VFNQVGPLEVGIVLVIVLLIFGPKRLPAAGKALGKSMREFKDSIAGKDDDDDAIDPPKGSAESHNSKNESEAKAEPSRSDNPGSGH